MSHTAGPGSVKRGPSNLTVTVLITVMLIAGCSNSLWSKWQDMQCVENCNDPDPARRKVYEQPVWQTLTMFIGEMACLFAFRAMHSPYNPYSPAANRRRHAASVASRRAALSSQSARLHTAPLSRPDESAIFFNESAISLHDEQAERDRLDKGELMIEQDPGRIWDVKAAVRFWAPAACDICGTTAMNVGLLFVPVSIYQMLRGALVLWVGIFSVLFLNRRLTKAQWTALATVMLGIAVVGCSSLIGEDEKAQGEGSGASTTAEEATVSPLAGVALIVIAQVLSASQFVLEEKIMEKHAVDPLLAAGYEGTSGLVTTMIGLMVLHYFIGSTSAGRGGYFDAPTGWRQIVDNPKVWGSSIVIAISIACFNGTGLAVTKIISATARSTIDSCRTLGIWLVSLALGWEQFKWLQVLGFVLLVYGTFVFNGITTFPHWTGLHKESIPSVVVLPDEEDSLLGGSDGDDNDEEAGAGLQGRSRALDHSGRPLARRSGSGRRGEVSPLLKDITAD